MARVNEMVISNDPNYEKKKAEREQLQKSDEQRKELLWQELRKESTDIICLAWMYAKNFEETGEDITRCLITVERNASLLEAMYKKGVNDTLEKVRRGEIKI